MIKRIEYNIKKEDFDPFYKKNIQLIIDIINTNIITLCC